MRNGVIAAFIGLLCAGAFALGWLANGWRLSASHEKEKVRAAEAAGEVYQRRTLAMNRQAQGYLGRVEGLKKEMAELRKGLANAKGKGFFLDCRPDAERLRILKSAVDAANAAAGQ